MHSGIVILCAVVGCTALRFPTLELKENSELALQIKDLDKGFPSRHVDACPRVSGQEYLGTNDTWQPTLKDPSYCVGMLKAAEQSGECLIYNFGVGSNDRFLHHLAENHSKCEIFAFDPTVNETRWEGGAAGFFGPNVKFYSWGLYGGDGPRKLEWVHPRYQNAKHRVHGLTHGDLYTVQEIQEKLGHTGRRISLFRSDCEGCEWAWVDNSMREHPEVFGRIDQMFTEIHFAQTLRFDEEALSKAPSFHKMVMDNFDVVSVHENKGFNKDRNQVPQSLVDIGVDPFPCCREFLLLNKKASEAQKQ